MNKNEEQTEPMVFDIRVFVRTRIQMGGLLYE